MPCKTDLWRDNRHGATAIVVSSRSIRAPYNIVARFGEGVIGVGGALRFLDGLSTMA